MRNVLILLLLWASVTVNATTYYMATTGSDASGNGSASSPWKTLAYACSKATSSGDIIHVNVGTYIETVQCSLAVGVSIEGEGITSIITSNVSGTDVATIYLNSGTQGTNGNQHISNIKMDGNALTAQIGIKVNLRSNVVIHDVTFIDFMHDAIYIQGGTFGSEPTTYATGNQIYNCDLENCSGYYNSNGYGEIDFSGQDGLLIHDNTLNQTTRTGLNGYCTKAVGGYNRGVKIYNNYITKAEEYPAPFYIIMEFWNTTGGIEIYSNQIIGGYIDCGGNFGTKGSYNYTYDIHNNMFSLQNYPSGGYWVHGVGIEGAQSDIIVRNNSFTNFTIPICLTQNGSLVIQKIYIYYNIFNNISSTAGGNAGVILYNTSATASNDNIYVLDNVFYNGTVPTAASGVRIQTACPNTNIYIENNIFQGLTDGGYVWLQSGSVNGLTIQNNIAYGNGNSNNPLLNVTPTNYTGVDAIKSNPLFVSSSDFHLQSTSPAINAGIHITTPTILTDYDGVKIGNPPSIGAYESGSAVSVPTVPVYQSSVVASATPSLLEMTYSTTLANIVPDSSAFTVLVNSLARTVNTVAISGMKVQLTLASPIVTGDVVIVSYTIPATTSLQTAAGVQAVSISAQTVTNSVTLMIPVYSSAAVANATPSLLEMTYNLTLANILPAVSSFSVLVNSVATSVSSVAISGTKVQLTISSAIKYGDIVNVSYTKPAINPLQVPAGGTAASISGISVVNNLINANKDATSVTVTLTLYPNYVHKLVNVLLGYSSSLATQAATITPEILRISDLAGNLFVEKFLVTGVTSIKIPLNLRSGIYNVLMLGNGTVLTSRKIMVY